MSTMTAAAGPIEQSIRERAIAARKRLAGGNNQVRTDKVVVMSIVKRGEVKSRVRVSPDVPLPGAPPAIEAIEELEAVQTCEPEIMEDQSFIGPIAPIEPEPIKLPRSAAIQIMREVAAKHGVTMSEIFSHIRHYKFWGARHEAAFRIYTELHWPVTKIGRFLDRDYTTVLHSIQKFSTDNPEAAEALRLMEDQKIERRERLISQAMALYESGTMSSEAIGNKLGILPVTVRRWAVEYRK